MNSFKYYKISYPKKRIKENLIYIYIHKICVFTCYDFLVAKERVVTCDFTMNFVCQVCEFISKEIAKRYKKF